MPFKVLTALDATRIQRYHLKAIIIAGMGLFTVAYELFCIPPAMNMIGDIYYDSKPIPTAVLSSSVAMALLGTAAGQPVFGRLRDLTGRRRVYGTCLLLTILGSFACGFSVCTTTRTCEMVGLGFFRFVLGLGIGDDHLLSAAIVSEFANRRKRGGFEAAVFSMQGRIVVSPAVIIVVCEASNAATTAEERARRDPLPPEADFAWRLILMLGALPAAFTFPGG